MGVKAQRAAATRTRLVAAARALFAAEGYAATGTEAILAAAGVTRGALYHHFADKQALFAAVCEQLHEEAEHAIEADADAQGSAFDGLTAGCLAFLDFMAAPQARRILDDWATFRARFVKVMPNEYRRALSEMAAQKQLETA